MVNVFDPWADKEEVKHEYGIDLLCGIDEIKNKTYEGVVLAVAHDQFKELDFPSLRTNDVVVYNVKGILNRNLIDNRL